MLQLGRYGLPESRIDQMSWGECERLLAAAQSIDARAAALNLSLPTRQAAPVRGDTIHYRSRRRK